jgi:5-methylcytosine-specific restriction protein B
MGLTDSQKAVPHDPENEGQTEVAYRLAWARTYLKKAGFIHSPSRGTWALTPEGSEARNLDGRAIARQIRAESPKAQPEASGEEAETYLFAWNPERFEWKDLDAQIRAVQETGAAEDTWSCGSVKNIPPGSRFFLIRLGHEPRGIVGAGVTLDEVYEAPHYQEDRAARGEKANRVDIRFDALSRVPIVRRSELDEPPFEGVSWDTQMSGVKIPRAAAGSLEQEWRRRLRARELGEPATLMSAQDFDRWRELWNQARADATWVERHRLRDSKRREVLPEIRELVTGFIGGQMSLPDFRETFDRKTRNEWDLFGLKGLSGAMFLNKFAKYLPDQDDAASVLRATLQAPTSEIEARTQLHELMAYLDRQISAGVATGAGLQPNRSPFFVSACWHAQQPGQWPIMFQSARDALQADGLLGRNLKGADGYLEFTRVFRALSEGLGISFWELEHLCARSTIDLPVDSDNVDQPDEEPQRERVWLIAPGPGASMFDDFYRDGIVAIGWDYLSDLAQYPDVEAIRQAIQQHRGGTASPTHDALACHQFAHEMQVGDIVFAKRGRREIVGYGVVSSAYRYEPERQTYVHVRSVDWKKRGQWVPRDKPLVTKTLTDIGQYPGLVADIRSAIGTGDAGEASRTPIEIEVVPARPVYTIEDVVEDMFLPRLDIEEALELLSYKKNLVIQGPPGVGKTFFAKRLAYLLLGEKDPERVSMVQFHQSYSYEDFVQGYRPTESGKFARVDGPFLRFCDQALQDASLPYVLIIDEINRGNLSKIFGELLMLMEADKRSDVWATSLIYSREGEPPFSIPKNLHVIGTMNTADRSLAMVDYALRRRFVFVDLGPGFEQPSFARKLSSLGVDATLRDRIVKRLERLNGRIRQDPSLGDGFCIGHSYFCQVGGSAADDSWYKRIVRTEIGPLLREYWFDNAERAADELAQLLDDD